MNFINILMLNCCVEIWRGAASPGAWYWANDVHQWRDFDVVPSQCRTLHSLSAEHHSESLAAGSVSPLICFWQFATHGRHLFMMLSFS